MKEKGPFFKSRAILPTTTDHAKRHSGLSEHKTGGKCLDEMCS